MTRTAKRIDRLKLITYDRDVVVPSSHQLHDLCLKLVRVLILVDHDVAILVRELFAHRSVAFERFAQTHEQIVIRQHVAAALKLLESLEQRLEIAALIDELRILLIQHLLQRLDLVDHHAEDRRDGPLAWKVLCFIDSDLPAE